MNGLKKKKKARKGYMDGLEAIRYIMKVRKCTYAEAEAQLIAAIKSGEIRTVFEPIGGPQ